MSRRLPALATTVALAIVVAAAAPARGATVSLRVDSATEPVPLFDGAVTTLPHAVDGNDGSGAHPCTGSAGSPAVATATGALNDAMRGAGIPWRGNWDPSFHDFFIDRIGPYASAPPSRYWSLTINGRFASGGCLAQVADGDAVHFSYGSLFDEGPSPTGGGAGGSDGQRAENGAPAPTIDPSTARLRGIVRRAGGYLRRSGGAGAEWSRVALALRRGKGTAPAAAALISAQLQKPSDVPIDDDVNATAIAVLALRHKQPRAAARAARWLASAQAASGGFGFRPGITPDVDSTGLAVWALAAAGRTAAVARGAAFVRSAQADDGGFPAIPGGASNAQSTGLALVALRVAGLAARTRSNAGRTPLDFLVSLARPNGSIAYDERSSPTPTWTTAQALLGLTSREKLLH